MQVEKTGDGLRVKRELEDGWFQHVDMPLPALLTIQSGGNKLRYATLMGIKKAKSKQTAVVTPADPGAPSIECDEGLPAVQTEEDRDAEGIAGGDRRANCREVEVRGTRPMSGIGCGVLVITEQRQGAWNKMSFEAVAAGLELAKMLGTGCSAAVFGAGLSPLTTELATKELDKVYSVQHDLLADYTADGAVIALEQAIRQAAPDYVVFPHTYQVRDFAPALATRFGQVLISDAIAIHEGPVFVRQLLQGKLNADYRPAAEASSGAPRFISVQAGTFLADALGSGQAEIVSVAVELGADQIRNKPGERFRESAQTVDLAAAPLIVSVGRGIKEEENIAIVQELADALGAELAASRPICDNGWLPMERQVGSSGQTVAPKLYLAVGISGAIQHLVGMKGAKTIIAINKDENAPIFEIADYGVVGDLFELVPALTKAIQAAKS